MGIPQSSVMVGVISNQEILSRAVAVIGLEISRFDQSIPGVLGLRLAEFEVDDELVAALGEQGFKIACYPTTTIPLGELRLFVAILFQVNLEGVGVRFLLTLQGGARLPRSDAGGHTMMGALLIKQRMESGAHFPQIVWDLVTRRSLLWIPFGDLGLYGMKPIDQLFEDHFKYRRRVIELAQSNVSPLEPSPYSQETQLYATKQQQATLVYQWEKQLNQYRGSLVS